MVEPGGLKDITDVKILVCYLLSNVENPISYAQLLEAALQEGLVNYFELTSALSELIEAKHICNTRIPGEELAYYTCTDTGAEIAALLEQRLPASVKERTLKAAIRLLRLEKTKEETRCVIKKNERGFEICCSVLDGDESMMNITLLVSDRAQAECIKEQFLKNPAVVYQGTIALLTGDLRTVGSLLIPQSRSNI